MPAGTAITQVNTKENSASAMVRPICSPIRSAFGRWYATGGKEGAEPPPEMKRIVEIVDKARTVGPDEQVKLSQELYRNWAENVYEIGTIGLTPMVQGVVVTAAKFRNVPTTLGNDWPLRSPGNARTEQFFFAAK